MHASRQWAILVITVGILTVVWKPAAHIEHADQGGSVGLQDQSDENGDSGVSVYGRVVLLGDVPNLPPIDVAHSKWRCNPGLRENRALIIGQERGIANAVVYMDRGSQKWQPGSKFNAPVIDQKMCEYMPHVQIATLGSSLRITNSDPTLHNVHAYKYNLDTSFGADPQELKLHHGTAFNVSILKGAVHKKQLDWPGLLKLVCDLGHTWMTAYIIVAEHPYYSVTDSTGRFRLGNVPQGGHTLKVWHEYLGMVEMAIKATTDTEIQVEFTSP